RPEALPAPSRRSSAPVALPGLAELWTQTRGDPRVRVAVLDGPVDLGHESISGADLEVAGGPAPDGGPATRHGTHVVSVLFGQPGGPVAGLAPRCRGLLIPVYESAGDGTVLPCSQLDLARALTEAILRGA